MMDSLKNFQTYISQANSLMKTAKTGMKTLKGLGAINPSALTQVFNGYLTPVFTLLGKYRQYIPKTPTLPS